MGGNRSAKKTSKFLNGSGLSCSRKSVVWGGVGGSVLRSLEPGCNKGETGLLALLGASWGSVGPSRVPLGTLWVTLGTLVGPLWGLLGGLGEALGAVEGLKEKTQKKDATQ